MSQSLLDSHVLILNRFYMAIRVVDVRRTLTLLYRQCAEVISHEAEQFISYDFDSWCEMSQLNSLEKQPGDDFIQAVGFEIQVPRIARLTRFDRMPQQTVRFNRKNLFARDEHTCQYCGKDYPTHKLSLDHVVPRSQGGPTTWENIVACCLRCNSRKGGRTPKQAGMKLRTMPGKPRFDPLVTFSVDDQRYRCWKTFLPAAG